MAFTTTLSSTFWNDGCEPCKFLHKGLEARRRAVVSPRAGRPAPGGRGPVDPAAAAAPPPADPTRRPGPNRPPGARSDGRRARRGRAGARARTANNTISGTTTPLRRVFQDLAAACCAMPKWSHFALEIFAIASTAFSSCRYYGGGHLLHEFTFLRWA